MLVALLLMGLGYYLFHSPEGVGVLFVLQYSPEGVGVLFVLTVKG